MTLDEFFEELKEKPIEHYIVTLKYKYDFEKDYTIDNEILEVDMENYPDCYVWLCDWNEGQTDVEVLGYIPVREVITDKEETINAILIPDNATNGDMIKATFPNIKVEYIRKLSGVNYYRVRGMKDFGFQMDFYEVWWNAPYKADKEDKE